MKAVLLTVSLIILVLSFLPLVNAQSLSFEKTWGGAGIDEPTGISADSLNNVYITGYTDSFGGNTEVALLKYDSSGNLLWQKTWGGIHNDYGYGLTIDSLDNIYIVGYTDSFGTPGVPDILLLKFDSEGNLLWQRTWGGSDRDYGRNIAIDSSGIYITGITHSYGVGGDVVLLKFDFSGNLLWQRVWGGSSDELGNGVDAGPSGIYVTGHTSSFGAGGKDVFLLKLDFNGDFIWQKTWGDNYEDLGYNLVIGSSGIYVTGETNNFGSGSYDVLLLKFDSLGNPLWQNCWGGSNYEYGYRIALDNLENIYFTGSTKSSSRTLNEISGIMSTSSDTLNTLSGTLGTPTGAVGTPSGTVNTPSGSETYVDYSDFFLLKLAEISTPSQPITSPVGGIISPINKPTIIVPYLALAGLIIAVSTVYVIRRRKD